MPALTHRSMYLIYCTGSILCFANHDIGAKAESATRHAPGGGLCVNLKVSHGPQANGYPMSAATTIAASVNFAHRSRLFTIRTVIQIQNAAKETPRAGSRMVIRSPRTPLRVSCG